MEREKSVPIMLTIPKQIKDHLRKLAAEMNLKNPDENATASGLGRQILCDYLQTLMTERSESNGRIST